MKTIAQSLRDTALPIFLALWMALTPAFAGSMMLLGVGGGSAAAAPSYSYLGPFNNNGSTSGTTVTMPFTMTGVGGTLVVFFGIQGGGKTFTSVVYDPTGANVTLTPDTSAGNSTTNTNGMFSGTIPAASGSKNVVVTLGASVSFLISGGQAWLATGLGSSANQTGGNTNGLTTTISVTSGYFMFCGAFQTSSFTGVTWSGSTQAPAAAHDDANNESHGADWTIASTNASFSATPNAAHSFNQSCATFH